MAIRLLLNPRQTPENIEPDWPERVAALPGDVIVQRRGDGYHVYTYEPGEDEEGELVLASLDAAVLAARGATCRLRPADLYRSHPDRVREERLAELSGSGPARASSCVAAILMRADVEGACNYFDAIAREEEPTALRDLIEAARLARVLRTALQRAEGAESSAAAPAVVGGEAAVERFGAAVEARKALADRLARERRS